MEGVARQEGYRSEDLLLRIVVWKGLVTKGGEGCGMECEAESKPRGTANLFRRIPSGVMKSVGKK